MDTDTLVQELKIKKIIKEHLIKKGLTYSPEREWAGEPTIMREVAVDTIVDEVFKCLIKTNRLEGELNATN